MQALLNKTALDVLKMVPNRPFLCLPMSAIFVAILKDNHGIDAHVITGNLQYINNLLFKQECSISDCQDGIPRNWDGHAWAKVGGHIYDLSIFRTVYSDKFTKPCKAKLIKNFGEGKGMLAATPDQMEKLGFVYDEIDFLKDDIITGIIQGFDALLKSENF